MERDWVDRIGRVNKWRSAVDTVALYFTEKVDTLNTQLTHWLRHASKSCLMDTGGISLFSSSSKKQVHNSDHFL